MNLDLAAKQVAACLGVSKHTVWEWDWGRADPQARFLPAIIEFLGYAPLPPVGFSGWLQVFRRRSGFTQKQLAAGLGVHRTTVHRWERVGGRNRAVQARGTGSLVVIRARLRDSICRCWPPPAAPASIRALARL